MFRCFFIHLPRKSEDVERNWPLWNISFFKKTRNKQTIKTRPPKTNPSYSNNTYTHTGTHTHTHNPCGFNRGQPLILWRGEEEFLLGILWDHRHWPLERSILCLFFQMVYSFLKINDFRALFVCLVGCFFLHNLARQPYRVSHSIGTFSGCKTRVLKGPWIFPKNCWALVAMLQKGTTCLCLTVV